MKSGAALAVGLLLVGTGAQAIPTHNYEVTVRNLTCTQNWGKPLIVAHDDSVHLFRVGERASSGLTRLAEEGDNATWAATLTHTAGVMTVVAPDQVLPHCQTQTYYVHTNARYPLISVAGMLGTTNDTFGAVDSIPAPADEVTVLGNAYDAGTERNNELCAFIPGVPCNHPGVRDTAGAEGSIQLSTGIAGRGDLDPVTYGWNGPVIKVTIKKID